MENLSDIARLRLISQHIAGTHFKDPKELVAHMGAMQAQDPVMAKWAIGIRLHGATNTSVENAINKSHIFRTHVMRPTWHFVSADDIYWMLELSAPQIDKLLRSRYKELELSEKLLSKTNALLEKLLQDDTHLTREEITAAFKKAKIVLDNNRSSHIMMHAELSGLIASGKINGTKHTYALLANRVKKKKSITRDEALVRLAERYFTSHGPATLADFTWWSGLPVKDARSALENIKEKFISETIHNETYWFLSSLKLPAKNKSSIHLLPAFDEYLISYKDRTASLLTEHHKRAFSSNGIFWPTLEADGKVTGLWKRTLKKDNVSIETDFFDPNNQTSEKELEKAASMFGNFLEKKVELI